ncbi:MAG TPA: protein kinase [Planctomycetota bacterium]|jgi:predicted ATPase/tRNA A-37 threonylcarbamoyl transferase component Bud32|nr:protein kinase [Planctomycetota bacterium]
MSAPPRASLERFRIEHEIGAGATGTVHVAVARSRMGAVKPGDRVAVKFLRQDLTGNERARRRFLREARAGLRVRHSNLVRIHAVEEATILGARVLYLVMDLVEGETLRRHLERHGPLAEGLVRSVGAQAARALGSLHAAGLVHLDVKPENVTLTPDGRAVLMDLGFARSFKGVEESEDLSLFGGSLAYAAPERLRGRPPDPRADLYSLGVSLYELSCGQRPFPGSDLASVLHGHLEGKPPPPSDVLPRISPFLDRLVLWCLEKTPGSRPSDARLLAAILEQGEASPWWQKVSALAPERARVEARLAPRARRHLVPFQGRTREIGALLGEFERARRKEFRAVLVEGVPGIGKSRLIEEFASRVAGTTGVGPSPASKKPVLLARYLYGRSPRVEEPSPCAPFLAMVERYLGLPRGARPSEASARRLRAILPEESAAAILGALRGEGAGPPLPRACARFLDRLARESPLVACVDELENADGATLRVLGFLLEEKTAPMLLLLARRPAGGGAERLALSRRARERLTTISLQPLPREEVERIVERLFHPKAPRQELAAALFERSRGEPGLLAEILRSLVGGRAVETREGLLFPTIPPAAIPFPASLEETISAGLASLPGEERLWLERAAVAGSRFDGALLARAFDAEPLPVLQVLSRLENPRGLVVSAGAGFRFARPLLREVLYGSIPAHERREIHRRLAIALERAAGKGKVGEREALAIATHASRGGDDRRALRYLPDLVESSLRSNLFERARALARTAIEHLNRFPRAGLFLESRADLLLALAAAEGRLGAREEERRATEKAARIAQFLGDRIRLARALLGLGRYAHATSKYLAALGFLGQAARIFAAAGERRGEVEAELLRAAVLSYLGQHAEALAAAQRAGALARERDLRARVALARGRIHANLERPIEALAELGFSEAEFRRLRDEVFRAMALFDLARIHTEIGAYGLAREQAREAVELTRRTGDRRFRASAESLLGEVLVRTARFEEAAEHLQAALDTATETGDRFTEAHTRVHLAGLHLEERYVRADLERARREGELAVAAAQDLDLASILALARAVRSRIFRRGGDLGEALAVSRGALAALRHARVPARRRIVVCFTHHKVLRALGEEPESRRYLARAVRLVRARAKRITVPRLRETYLREERTARRVLRAWREAGRRPVPAVSSKLETGGSRASLERAPAAPPRETPGRRSP